MISRRKLLLGAGAAATVAAAGVNTFALEPLWLEVPEIDWPVPNLPRSVEGMRIAHVTDVHLNGIGQRAMKVIHAIERSRCQLVMLTGDILDRPWFRKDVRSFIDAIRAAVPRIIAVLGNWEHYIGPGMDFVHPVYTGSGAQLLCNESTVIEGVRFVGSDDDMSGFADHKRCAQEIVPGQTTFYLSHSPGFLSVLPPLGRYHGIFSGHTHGGQAQIFNYSPFLPPGSGPYRAGAYETKWGPLYVSRGTGTTYVRGRFLCRPEMPIYTLVRG